MTNLIKIDCPNCHTKYNVPADKVAKQTKIKLNCKNCSTSFMFEVPKEISNTSGEDKKVADDSNTEVGVSTTIITGSFSESGDASPEFFPKDAEITLTYEFDGKEIKKVVDKLQTIIGRTDGDIIINDPKISKKHASIEIKNPTMVELRDLASTNGTFHNGMKINSVFLQSGDIIKIGSVSIHFSSQVSFA